MNITYFPNQIAQNAPPVLEAFLSSCRQDGHTTIADSLTADAAVIWSQVWAGRMRKNHKIWQTYRSTGRPVFVLEVGSLQRGVTWRVGKNGAHSFEHFGATGQSSDRARLLNLKLHPWNTLGNYVMICTQRGDSEQWAGQPELEQWVSDTIKKIKAYTNRPIVLRPHPRFQLHQTWPGVTLYQPQHVPNTYDSFDFEHALINAHAVVNWNSGPGTRAILHGVPAFVGPSSLASTVGNNDFSQIETPLRPDRQQWLNDLAYTEWTVPEIAQGLPLRRLI